MSRFLIKTIGNTLNATSYVSAKYASKKALHLFATPRKGRYSELQEDLVKNTVKENLQYDHLNIATYQWQGKGKTVLLAHGWESNASRWNYLVKVLQPLGYNVIALDAPAHGKSDGRQFNAILYAECIAQAMRRYQPKIVIGHSVGGMSTIFSQFTYQFPFIEKIVLLGAPAHFTGVFTRYKHMMGFNSRVSNALDHLIFERFSYPVDYFSTAKFTESITVDGLIIHDKNDLIIPYEDAQLIHKHYKNSKLVTTNNLGHGLKDSSLNDTIVDFIQ